MFRNYENVGGVTLHRITMNVDAGPIVKQISFKIRLSDTIETARKRSDIIAAQMIKDFLHGLNHAS